YEILTWVGIVGGALTLFGNLDAVLKLADWARLLVQNWKDWTHAFWLWAFGWLGIHLPPEWTPLLSFLLFGSLLTIGQAVQFKSAVKNQPIEDKYQGKSFQLRTALKVGIYTLLGTIIWTLLLLTLLVWTRQRGMVRTLLEFPMLWVLILLVVPTVIVVIWFAR